jgi:hypothetical protein
MFESRCLSLSPSLSLSSSLSSYIFAFPLKKTKERFNQVFFFNKENLLLFLPFISLSLSLSLVWSGTFLGELATHVGTMVKIPKSIENIKF